MWTNLQVSANVRSRMGTNQSTITLSPEVEYLTPQQAAALAGMSRAAFLLHVQAQHILPDKKLGTRSFFSRELVEQWTSERTKNGAKKRGPKPQRRRR